MQNWPANLTTELAADAEKLTSLFASLRNPSLPTVSLKEEKIAKEPPAPIIEIKQKNTLCESSNTNDSALTDGEDQLSSASTDSLLTMSTAFILIEESKTHSKQSFAQFKPVSSILSRYHSIRHLPASYYGIVSAMHQLKTTSPLMILDVASNPSPTSLVQREFV